MRARLALVVALILGGVGRAAEPKEPTELRLAVMPFDSSSQDPQFGTLGAGLQAMLTTDLAAAPQIKLVERDKLAAIKAELALTKSAAFDKATSVKVGKLLGASHLLTGAITVLGQGMRIDARLIDASSGEVVLGDKIEGEKDLFFELEKALAQKLIAALGAALTPKERARLAKIHTADFDAFRRFSDGIDAFDHKSFDDARKALRDALDRDQEFQLARLTLDDYESIIAKLGARKDLLEAGERQAKVEARTARATEQQAIFKRLFALLDSKDDTERLPALFSLARLYDHHEYRDLELHQTESELALARTCDSLWQTWFAEATKAFPKVALFGDYDSIARPPISAEDVQKKQEWWLKRFFGTNGMSDAQRKNWLLDDIQRGIDYRHVARRLHLSLVDEARLDERAYKLALALDPDQVDAFFERKNRWRGSILRSLGQRFREAGLFDESTRWFAEYGRAATEPNHARWASDEVERNRDIVKFLAAHPSPRVREYMMMRRYELPDERYEVEWVAQLEEKTLPPKARSVLGNAREIRANRDNPFVLINGRALYPADATFFATGRRTDPRVARDLDYYRDERKASHEEWWEAWFDGQHKGALTARFTLGYGVDDEWWDESLSGFKESLQAAGFVDARPEVVFLFGASDVMVPDVEDPEKQNQRRLQRPMRAYGLRIAKDRIELVKIVEPEVFRGFSVARDRLSFEVLDSDEGSIKDGAKVSLSVHGREVSAKVGGLSVGETLAEVPAGFTGFAFLGPGHLAMIAPEVTIGR